MGIVAASETGEEGARIAIYPESGRGATVAPSQAFDSAKKTCTPGDFDLPPWFDPRGLGPHGREGERGTVTPLEVEIPGWRTVACVREFTTYNFVPGSVGPSPSYQDTGERREASTAALGTTDAGEDVIVIFMAQDPEVLERVRGQYFEKLGEGRH